MILQALKEYYDRKAADPDSGIAPLGWEWKEIPYLIILDREGNLVNVEDTQEIVSEKPSAKSFYVSQSVKRSGKKFIPYFLWDNVAYVTGTDCKGNQDNAIKQHAAFMEKLHAYTHVPSVHVIEQFLSSPDFLSQLEKFPAWQRAKETCAFVAFRFSDSNGTIFDEEEVKKIVDEMVAVPSGETVEAIDLISGQRGALAATHPSIKGVAGANTTGANIVSFNFPAAKSFGKEQGENSPISTTSAFEYTTALNTLLSKDSKQKIMVGDATVVFWAAKNDAFEDALAGFFAEPAKDNPDRLVQNVEALFKSPQTGAGAFCEDDTRFFVLGLAPNSARISIRFWSVGTVAEMAGRFREYFDDLTIVHAPREKDHLSLWRLLVSTAVLGKSENIPPNLAGEFMRSILEGLPFPATLLPSVLRRIKAEHEVSYPRAKLIKGCLNRKWRFTNPNNERKLTVSLDKENKNIGYRLGRLFAVLEKIQVDANSGLNATIKDRFFGSASSAPITVFGNLLRLAQHHLSKLKKEKPGYAINLEKTLQEIVAEIAAFPAHLSLDDQGQFAIGYYHQRQAFFAKKEDAQPQEN